LTPEPAQAVRPAAEPVIAASATGGPWKVQLGAFGVQGNADRLWARLSKRAELAGAQKLTVPTGRLTKLLAGGFDSRDAAEQACNALKRGGQDCLVTR
jgi:cell division septation protein DedD